MEGQLREYFRAKRLRDKKVSDEAKKIAFNDNLTKAEKDARIRDLQIPCKRCKGDSVLTFIRSGTNLLIRCSSGNSKCNKDVSRGAFAPIGVLQDNARERAEQLRMSIIQLRLEQVYGLVDETAALASFEVASAELAKEEATIERLRIIHDEATGLPQRRSKAKELSTQLQSDIMAVREDISGWKKTNETDLLNAAVERYGSVVQPLAKELRETKYSEAFTAKTGEEVTLIERQTSIQQDQVSLSS